MLIERVWAANRGRNFHYLIACPETREALAVDPLNARGLPARGRASWAGASARSSIPTSTATTPAATPRWSRRPARRCWRTRPRPSASAASHMAWTTATWCASADRCSCAAWIHPATRARTCACTRKAAGDASAGAVLRRHAVQCRRRQLHSWRRSRCCCTRPSAAACRSCRPRRACFPGMNTCCATSVLHLTANHPTPRRAT